MQAYISVAPRRDATRANEPDQRDGERPASPGPRRDAVITAALAVIRRALVEGRPVTRSALAEEASVALGAPPDEALKALDVEAQRVGISSLL
jgi:hypothetical protein